MALPPLGSATPLTDTAAEGDVARPPAQIFSSGPITVSTQGTPADGSVTSSAEIDTVNTSEQESLTADALDSICEATEEAITGSTTITNGTLMTDSGDDNHPPVIVDLPADPAPNTEYVGHVHIGDAQDDFRYVFNEQVVTGESITVSPPIST